MLVIKNPLKLAIATKLITSLWKYLINKSKNVVIIVDSVLSNINGKGLSKSKKVDVLNITGATSGDIVDKIDDVLERKPK